jgi:hypothetical protein
VSGRRGYAPIPELATDAEISGLFRMLEGGACDTFQPTEKPTMPNDEPTAPRFSETELDRIAGALRAAAEVYDADAKNARDALAVLAGNAGVCRLAEQFDRQATQARELAERIEQR